MFEVGMISALLRESAYGQTVELPAGQYLLGEEFVPAAGRTIDARRAMFVSMDAAQPRTLTITGDGVTWLGGHFQGAAGIRDFHLAKCIEAEKADTKLDDDAAPMTLHFDGCVNLKAHDVRFQGVEKGLTLTKCIEPEVLRIEGTGLSRGEKKVDAAGVLVRRWKDFFKTSYLVNIRGGSNGYVGEVKARNCGGALVMGSGDFGMPRRWRIDYTVGKVLGDEGIYISSGENVTISNCDLQDINGFGISIRGYGHIVRGCDIWKCDGGILTEGIGKTPDAQGAATSGVRLLGNTIRASNEWGIASSDNQGLVTRDLVVADNYLIETAMRPTKAGQSIRAPMSFRGGNGYTIERNVVDTFKTPLWLAIGQMMPDGIKGYDIAGNNRVYGEGAAARTISVCGTMLELSGGGFRG